MDRNSIIGLVLIALLFVAWQYTIAPSQEELAARQRMQDSLARVEQEALSQLELEQTIDELAQDSMVEESDSIKNLRQIVNYGSFASAVGGEESIYTVENNVVKVNLSSQGGRVVSVQLKDYKKMIDYNGTITESELILLDGEDNKFEYELPVANTPNGVVRSSELTFSPVAQDDKSITLRATASNGGYFEQKYSLTDSSYIIDYDLSFSNLQQVFANNASSIKLYWEDHLEKIEKNAQYEANYSSVYFKPVDDDPDHCGCMSDDVEELGDQKIKWFSHTQQFFTSALFADDRFQNGRFETRVLTPEEEDLKVLVSNVGIPYGRSANEQFGMSFYVGPNEFDRMRAIGDGFTDVIPYGSSIFGAVNRWIIRPMFNFLNSIIGKAGISILVLTLLVKLMLYPLTYKSLVSNMKMQVLKPEIEKLKKKMGDDKQALQMETMKLYGEYGASPLGGCLPMVLQMPIWIALYRYFPAAIEFRQESFLWATDLSTYDSILALPEWVPLMQGHLSLFALLWAITTVIYAYYNSKHMDFSAQPMMKYLQYFMPIIFIFFFNSFAAGLTCYLLFSNLFNIGQTIVTKNYLIDQDKLLTKLQANKAKPKKKTGFRARLEEAMKEQERVRAQQQAKKSRR
ncbi:MAG: membrane protein insertase YidC [Bacteroidota bacterium]